MKTLVKVSWIVAISLAHTSAMAQTSSVSVADTVTQSMALAAETIMPEAIIWLSSFILLQFFITNFWLIKSGGDIESVIGKFAGSMAWFSFCFWVLKNGPDFIDGVGHDVLTKFAPNLPSFGSIVATTLAMCTTLLFAVVTTGTSIVGTGNSAVANVLVIVLFFVFSVGMYMAIKIAMLTLELAIIIMLAPLSFSMLGLNALRDQGIAPFKALISLIYRIVLLGVFCGAFSKVSKVAGAQLTSIDWGNPTEWGTALNVILSMLAAYPLLVYLVYKSDSIAASVASGSTGSGTGDVASAAAAGAAAGSAITSAGKSTASTVGKIPQGVGNVIKALVGNGSMANASERGSGGQDPMSSAPRKAASMSVPASNSSVSGAPRRESTASPSADMKTSSSAQASSRPTSVASNDAAPGRPAREASNDSATVNSSSGKNSSGAPEQRGAAAALGGSPGDRPGMDKVDKAHDGAQTDPKTDSIQKPTANSETSDQAPVRPTQGDQLRPPVRPVGSSETAGISGASSTQGAGGQQQSNKSSALEKIGKANEHMAQERATTHVTINTHHAD